MAHSGFSNITSNTTTTVRTGRCVLGRIVVNNPGSAWVAKIYNNTSGSGQLVGTMTVTATEEYEYDIALDTGLTIVTSGTTAGDLTVIYD